MKARESTLAFLFVIFGLIHSRNYKVMKYIEAEKKTSALTCVMLTVHPIYAEIQGVSLKKNIALFF
jgi:hypothetical protein